MTEALVSLVLLVCLFMYGLWEREQERKRELARRQRLFYWYYIFPMQVKFRRTMLEVGERLLAAFSKIGLAANEAGEALARLIRSTGIDIGDDIDTPNEGRHDKTS